MSVGSVMINPDQDCWQKNAMLNNPSAHATGTCGTRQCLPVEVADGDRRGDKRDKIPSRLDGARLRSLPRFSQEHCRPVTISSASAR